MSRAMWGVCLFAGLSFGQAPMPTAAPTPVGPVMLEHWIAFAEVLGRDDLLRYDHEFNQPLEVQRNNQLRDLEALPTTGIDPELVGYIKQLVEYGRAKSKSDKLVRWYHGVLVATPAEVIESRKKRAVLEAELPKLRERLMKRHGGTFPVIALPQW